MSPKNKMLSFPTVSLYVTTIELDDTEGYAAVQVTQTVVNSRTNILLILVFSWDFLSNEKI